VTRRECIAYSMYYQQFVVYYILYVGANVGLVAKKLDKFTYFELRPLISEVPLTGTFWESCTLCGILWEFSQKEILQAFRDPMPTFHTVLQRISLNM